jgi:hypothetical protein
VLVYGEIYEVVSVATGKIHFWLSSVVGVVNVTVAPVEFHCSACPVDAFTIVHTPFARSIDVATSDEDEDIDDVDESIDDESIIADVVGAGDPFEDDPFEDDPFEDDPFEDDPFEDEPF